MYAETYASCPKTEQFNRTDVPSRQNQPQIRKRTYAAATELDTTLPLPGVKSDGVREIPPRPHKTSKRPNAKAIC